MGRAEALIRRTDAVLTKVGPPTRLVYTRVTVKTGGDALIGLPQTITSTDTLLDPQPLYGRINVRVVRSREIVDDGNLEMADDYSFLFSSTAISLESLQNPDLRIVLKDANNAEEIFKIFQYRATSFQGVTIIYNCILRSVSR